MAFFPLALLAEAKEATKRSYAPFSGFNVGVALRCNDGKVIQAANIEFAVSAIGICAERLALSIARMQKLKPTHIAICSHHEGDYNFHVPSCGLCRQAMVEFEGLKLVTPTSCKSVKNLLPKPYAGRKPRV